MSLLLAHANFDTISAAAENSAEVGSYVGCIGAPFALNSVAPDSLSFPEQFVARSAIW